MSELEVMVSDAEAVMALQRAIVGEVLGDIPDGMPDIPEGTDVRGMVVACARHLAEGVMSRGLAPEFEATVVEATVIHALAASAVRWRECPLSQSHPEAGGQLLAGMISETQSASYRVMAISGEFRMAPWRAKEVVGYRDHCSGERVDFDSWAEASGDPEFVRNLQAIFSRD